MHNWVLFVQLSGLCTRNDVHVIGLRSKRECNRPQVVMSGNLTRTVALDIVTMPREGSPDAMFRKFMLRSVAQGRI